MLNLGKSNTSLVWLQIIYLWSPLGFECWLELVGMTAPILIRPAQQARLFGPHLSERDLKSICFIAPNTTFFFLNQHKHRESFGGETCY